MIITAIIIIAALVTTALALGVLAPVLVVAADVAIFGTVIWLFVKLIKWIRNKRK